MARYNSRSGEEEFRTGFLADISTTGAMVWLPVSLQVGDKLEVVMKAGI